MNKKKKMKKMKTTSTAPKGITKIIAKRKPIPTWERVDNNLASASKHMGFKRTKGQKRDIKGMRSQVGLSPNLTPTLNPNHNPITKTPKPGGARLG